VLVADDNVDAVDSLAMMLELGGHEVQVAHDGRQALALAESFRPRVAVLDIGMPLASGYEVAAAIRAAPWGRTMVLIALTGWGMDDDRRKAHDAGFDQHMTKPIDPDALEASIAAVCRTPP
jgi:CheY-like chemotaxis protein